MSRLLILAELEDGVVASSTFSCIAFAQMLKRISGELFDLLVVGGGDCAAAAETLAGYGAGSVLVAADEALTHPSPEQVAALCVEAMQSSGASDLAATSSTFSKDVLPQAAALLRLPMISDVLAVERNAADGLVFKRPMYAGNLIATVAYDGDGCVFSVRGTAFRNPAPEESSSSIAALATRSLQPPLTRWIGLDGAKGARPELTSARVVVSGGRPLKDAETFERVIGGLADRLGGAVGATRAAVDAGIVPNELQVGQTGKMVAPELYIAAGISGSIQHIAGMKDSRVIVAINTDPEAPIFEVADYGLVADLFQAVPELTDSL